MRMRQVAATTALMEEQLLRQLCENVQARAPDCAACMLRALAALLAAMSYVVCCIGTAPAVRTRMCVPYTCAFAHARPRTRAPVHWVYEVIREYTTPHHRVGTRVALERRAA